MEPRLPARYRFPHSSAADDAAEVEQLGGVLGVPLTLGEVPIGVLLAADRNPRDFTLHEVTLLAGLAAHSAVAINNARLFETNRAALEDLREVNASLEQESQVRQRLSDLREQLTATVVRGGGLHDLGVDLIRTVGESVSIYDAEHRKVSGPLAHRLDVLLPSDAVSEVLEAAGRAKVLDLRTRVGESVLVAPVGLRQGYAGCIVADPILGRQQDLRRLLLVGSTMVALVVSSEHLLAEAELRLQNEFLQALLSLGTDESRLARRARSLGFDVEQVSVVLVIFGEMEGSEGPRQLATRLSVGASGWHADHRGARVVLGVGLSADEAQAEVDRIPWPEGVGPVGIAPARGGVHGLRHAYQRARNVATVLRGLGRPNASAQPEDLGMYAALFSQAGRGELSHFVSRTIGPVLDYDRTRGRDLAKTAAVYLDHAQQQAATARALHVHTNTLYRRIERLDLLLGPSWRTPERALETQMALRLHFLGTELRSDRPD